MTILLCGSRFHQANPRRGVAPQVLGFAKALRQRGERVDIVDPFGMQDGPATESFLADYFANAQPRAILAIREQRSSWSGWPLLGGYLGKHGVPLICVDVENPVCASLADVRFASQLLPGEDVRFLPPAVDPEIYHPIRAERDLAFTFVGRIDRLRWQSLTLLRQFPSFIADSSQDLEPRVPQHSMASLLARSVVGLDLVGKRPGAIHTRVFEALSTSTFALTPWTEALCACLDPGKEVFAYRDSGEMLELLQRINHDPDAHAAVLLAGRRRVMNEHTYLQRADTILREIEERPATTEAVAAQPTTGEKKVSIFMPVYNADLWVGAAVDSLLKQTHENLHILAVNDGSKDKSGEVLRAKAARDPRLQVLDFDINRGEAVRRNDALAQIPEDTEFLVNHDADDLSDPQRIATQVAFLERNPNVHCVGAQARLVDPHGDLRNYLRVATDPDEIDATFHQVNSVIHTAAMFRASVLQRVVGYRNSFRSVDDYDFLARLLESGFRIANLPEVLISRREHGGSVSKTYRGRQEILRQRVARRLEASLPWRLAQRKARSRLRVHLNGSGKGMEGRLLVSGRELQETEILDDFRYLRLPEASCSELWLVDCLEQLPRAAGMRALMEWHGWLEEDGRLMLETPDLSFALERAMEGKLGSAELLRHLFGDQVGSAVAHRDAYDGERLGEVLPRLGFEIEMMDRQERQGLPFLLVEARKRKITADEQSFAALDLLEDFLIDASEVDLREAWHRQLTGEPSMGSTGEGVGSSECAF